MPSHQQVNGNTEMPDEYTGDGEDHVMAFEKEDTVDLDVRDVVFASAGAQPVVNGKRKEHTASRRFNC